VFVHELVHARVMEHSPRIWDLVRSVIPDVDDARELLRDKALPVID
jgi:predicted metal-dependent hydrolase